MNRQQRCEGPAEAAEAGRGGVGGELVLLFGRRARSSRARSSVVAFDAAFTSELQKAAAPPSRLRCL